MVVRYFDGVVPAPAANHAAGAALAGLAAALAGRVQEAMARFAPHEALAAIWDVVGAANKYVVEQAPWVLAKQAAAGDEEAGRRLATTLYNLVEVLRLAGLFCEPFLPGPAAKLAAQLGLPDASTPADARRMTWGGYRPGTRVAPGPALFPKG